MSKTFRPWAVDDTWLLPPSVHDFVPAGHPAHLVRDLVCCELDLSQIIAVYTELRGFPPYHPAMMLYKSAFDLTDSARQSRAGRLN